MSLPDNRVNWLTSNLKKLCVLPWINLHAAPNGKIKLCCNIQNEAFVSSNGKDFNLGYDDIDTIWNSSHMTGVRSDHITNIGAKECKECYSVETLTTHSPRLGQNTYWLAKADVDADVKSYFDSSIGGAKITVDQMPVSLELRLGNTCNLKCLSCWPMSSSLVHDERSAAIDNRVLDHNPDRASIYYIWSKERAIVLNEDLKNWHETEMFMNNFRKIAPNLKRLYTTGGEPTLIKANYKMFQELLDIGNTGCRIEFTSNMAAWNPDFYDRLEQFENVEIQMSIDGVDEVGEYIRYPSVFSKVHENVRRVIELASTRPGWSVKCYSVVGALNFNRLEPIWEILNELATYYSKEIIWWPITLVSPSYMSMSAIPQDIRSDYFENINIAIKKYNPIDNTYFGISKEANESLTNSILNSVYKKELHRQLTEYVRIMDNIRQADGELIFGELLL